MSVKMTLMICGQNKVGSAPCGGNDRLTWPVGREGTPATRPAWSLPWLCGILAPREGLEIDTVSSPMQMHKLFAWERGGQIESVDSKAED